VYYGDVREIQKEIPIYIRTSSRVGFRRVVVFLTVVLFASIGAARIISTYSVFNQTVDEPDHIASGMEWLDRKTYTIDPEAPPLARVAVALGPFLDGLHLPTGGGSYFDLGNRILHARDQYLHNLALARMGVLPFFFLATAMVFVWSRKTFGDTSALLSTLLFSTLPPVLAHAGLATTDMALAATFMTSMLAFVCWLESPTYFRSCAFGLSVGLAVLSKFSALLFLPSCAVAILVCRWITTRPRPELPAVPWGRRGIAIAAATMMAFLTIWGAYRFSVQSYKPNGVPDENMTDSRAQKTWHRLSYVVAEHIPIPAPELMTGINILRLHNARGHIGYLLGKVRQTGWWYFFPVALAVKSPLAFLILTGIGLLTLGRRAWRGADWRALAPAVMAVTLLLVCMPSRINIGLRHILPIYPLLAIVAGLGAARLWNLARPKRVGPFMVVVLVIWQLTSSARIHPDYLSYFNELAGRHPDDVLVESDLDWGQDLQRLARELHARRIDSVALAYHGTAEPGLSNMPQWRNLQPCERATGWIAISEIPFKIGWGNPPFLAWAWLDAYEPRAMVGKSIRLYYIPEGTRIPENEGESGAEGCPCQFVRPDRLAGPTTFRLKTAPSRFSAHTTRGSTCAQSSPDAP
jgi:hypothetical protein